MPKESHVLDIQGLLRTHDEEERSSAKRDTASNLVDAMCSATTEFRSDKLHIATQSAGARFALRIDPSAAAAAQPFGGFELDVPINRCNATGEDLSVRLGPDEWLLLGQDRSAAGQTHVINHVLAKTFHSLVDVSHRSTSVFVEGVWAKKILNSGCPIDLSDENFPLGAATRTVFEKAEVVLIRSKLLRFRLEVWRSFAPYVIELLKLQTQSEHQITELSLDEFGA